MENQKGIKQTSVYKRRRFTLSNNRHWLECKV